MYIVIYYCARFACWEVTLCFLLMHLEIFIIISIILSTEWKSFHSRVIGVNFYTLPNICEISPDGPSPSCHLGDGFTDLVIVKECSRLQMHSHIQRNFNSKDQVSFVVMSEILMFTKPKILTKKLNEKYISTDKLEFEVARPTENLFINYTCFPHQIGI